MLPLGLLVTVSFLSATVIADEAGHAEIMRAEPRELISRSSHAEEQMSAGQDLEENFEEEDGDAEEANEDEVQEEETQTEVTAEKPRPMIGRAQKRHDITRHVEDEMLDDGTLSPSFMEIDRVDSKDVLSNATWMGFNESKTETESKEPTVDVQITSAFFGFLLQLIVLDFLYGRHVRMRPQSRIGFLSIGCALCCQPLGCCALLFPIDKDFLPCKCNCKRRSKDKAAQPAEGQQPQVEDTSPGTPSMLKANWKLVTLIGLVIIAAVMVHFGEFRVFNAVGFCVVGFLIVGIVGASEKDNDEGEVGEPVEVDAPADGGLSAEQPTA